MRRPGIVEEVRLDLELLRRTASIAESHSDTARLLQLNALADELDQHLLGELDFREEAHNAQLISEVLEEYRDDLFVPQIERDLVTEEVLVMELVEGERVAAGNALTDERAVELAQTFFRAYIRQVTVKGFYHADPHRGTCS